MSTKDLLYLHPLNFITQEEIDTLPTEELLKRLPSICEQMDKAEDSVVDCLELAYYDVFQKKNIWVDYPLLDDDSFNEEIQDTVVEVDNNPIIIGASDYVTFPVVFTNKHDDDIIVGHMVTIAYDSRVVTVYIKNTKVPKYIDKLFDVQELMILNKIYSDESYKYIYDFVEFRTMLDNLNSLFDDRDLNETIRKYNLDYLYDIERQSGIMHIAAYIKAMKAENIIVDVLKKSVSDYIEKNYGSGIKIETELSGPFFIEENETGSSFEIKIGDINGLLILQCDLGDDEYDSELIDVKSYNMSEEIKKVFKDKNKIRKDINKIVEPVFNELHDLFSYKEQIKYISCEIVRYTYGDSTDFDLSLLEKCPDVLLEIAEDNILKVPDNCAQELYDALLKGISMFAENNPDVTEIKLRNNLYYHAIKEED